MIGIPAENVYRMSLSGFRKVKYLVFLSSFQTKQEMRQKQYDKQSQNSKLKLSKYARKKNPPRFGVPVSFFRADSNFQSRFLKKMTGIPKHVSFLQPPKHFILFLPNFDAHSLLLRFSWFLLLKKAKSSETENKDFVISQLTYFLIFHAVLITYKACIL